MNGVTNGSTRPGRRLGAVCLAATLATTAFAQYPVQNDGRLLDANPSLTSGRYNGAIRPVSPLQLGNRAATGNLGGSFSLRSFSPIGDPTAFRATLGSSTLSNFLRDSVSTADAYRPLPGLGGAAYYDPALTAPTGAFLQGTGSYRDAIPRIESFRRDPLASRLPFGGRLDFRIREQDPDARPPSYFDSAPSAADASIFGLPATKLPGEVSFRLPDPTAPSDDEASDLMADSSHLPPDSPWAPIDLRLTGPSVEPLDFSKPSGTRALAERMPTLGEAGGALSDIFSAPPTDDDLPEVDAALLPGGDKFNDIQMALELRDNPQAEWFIDMQQALAGDAVATEQLSDQV
ncbi:MAG: hypothetical protein D6744_04600, partial [Planctomycetota bacterium]